MKELEEELGEITNGATLANYPGWVGGNPFLSYAETENSCYRSEKKDGFVTVCINGKTGGVNICIKVESVDEMPFTYPRHINGRDLRIPCLEKVTGTIVSVSHINDDQECDFFSDSYELIGRSCAAYAVDSDAVEKAEGLDLLYKEAETPGDEEAEVEASFERWNQFDQNMEKLWEMGYYGDFVILGALDD